MTWARSAGSRPAWRGRPQTLYEFVFDFLRTNANIYDGVALAVRRHGKQHHHHGLSSSNLSSARLKMKAQTDMSNSKRLGWPPATWSCRTTWKNWPSS
jgi:hypothetical protein